MRNLKLTGSYLPAIIRDNLPLLAVICAGVATAFFRLGDRGLWGDEVWQTLWSQEQSLAQTFLRFRTPPDLPLHFMLTHLAALFGTNEFLARLPSALLGAASVVALFFVGRRLFGVATGLVAALLFAAAPYHVWYAQDARPYSALAFYSLLSLYFFCRLLQGPSWRAWLGFTLATTLNLYNHLFGLFPLLSELVTGGLWATALWVRGLRSGEADRRKVWSRPLPTLIALGSGTLAALVLCFPLLEGITSYLLKGGPGEIAAPPFELSPAYLELLFGVLGAGTGWAFWLMGSLFLVGLAIGLYRRDWFVLVAVAWLSVPLLTLWLAQPRHVVISRYLLFLQPVYLLLIAYGLLKIPETLVGMRQGVLRAPPGTQISPTLFRSLPLVLPVMAVLAITFMPTWKIYWVEKLNDWSAVCSHISKNAEPGDVVTGDGYYLEVLSLCSKMQPGISKVEIANRGEYILSEVSAGGYNVWYIHIDPDSANADFVRRNYSEIPHTVWAGPGLTLAVSDGDYLPYPHSERLASLYYRAKDAAQPIQPDDIAIGSKITFHDLPGGNRNPPWPDYARVPPGGSYKVFLSLPRTQPRALRITYLNQPARNLNVVVDGTTLTEIKAGGVGDTWSSIELPIPQDAGETFHLELQNPGTITSAISEVEVFYP